MSCDKGVNNDPIALNNVSEINTFKTKRCNCLLQLSVSRKLDTYDMPSDIMCQHTQVQVHSHFAYIFCLSADISNRHVLFHI